ncbi:Hypothetical predicted protein [Mytilus galloprovincialis]|uniref:Uncharacterized protein n=1 Tax=Mytilus galloprovincialis TaxID=29158 RepID=A0A8B6DLX9_MYTGA|nr:Hypothetical predicted protein [Mytilus galloprovincialis]
MGIYIEGCLSLLTSETLIYGNDSTTYEDECKSTLQTTQKILATLFENCKLEPCDRYLEVMTKSLELEKAAEVPSELKIRFLGSHLKLLR